MKKINRLTWRRPSDNAVCPKVKPDADLEYIAGDFTQKVYEKLADYEDADEKGYLVRTPCKTGDKIYQIRPESHALGLGISERRVSAFMVYANGDYAVYHQGTVPCRKSELGKTWFLRREDAEAEIIRRVGK